MHGALGNPKTAFSKIEYEGRTVYFCSKHCDEEFKENPKKYLSKMKRVEHRKPEHYHH
jgi:YHS domain-containing protein